MFWPINIIKHWHPSLARRLWALLCILIISTVVGPASASTLYAMTADRIFAVDAETGTASILNTYIGAYPAGGALAYSTVPIPAAVWLFGGALGLLGVARRRSAT